MLSTEDSDHVDENLTIDIDIDALNNNINNNNNNNTFDDNMNFFPSSTKYCRTQNNIREEWNLESVGCISRTTCDTETTLSIISKSESVYNVEDWLRFKNLI